MIDQQAPPSTEPSVCCIGHGGSHHELGRSLGSVSQSFLTRRHAVSVSPQRAIEFSIVLDANLPELDHPSHTGPLDKS